MYMYKSCIYLCTSTYKKRSLSAHHCDLNFALPDDFHEILAWLDHSARRRSKPKATQFEGKFHGQSKWIELVDPEEFWKNKSHLVGGWATPLKNMKVSWDDYSQSIYGNIKNVPTTNQPSCQNLFGTPLVPITIPDLSCFHLPWRLMFFSTAIRSQLQQRHHTLQVGQTNLQCWGINFMEYGNLKDPGTLQ